MKTSSTASISSFVRARSLRRNDFVFSPTVSTADAIPFWAPSKAPAATSLASLPFSSAASTAPDMTFPAIPFTLSALNRPSLRALSVALLVICATVPFTSLPDSMACLTASLTVCLVKPSISVLFSLMSVTADSTRPLTSSGKDAPASFVPSRASLILCSSLAFSFSMCVSSFSSSCLVVSIA